MQTRNWEGKKQRLENLNRKNELSIYILSIFVRETKKCPVDI